MWIEDTTQWMKYIDFIDKLQNVMDLLDFRWILKRIFLSIFFRFPKNHFFTSYNFTQCIAFGLSYRPFDYNTINLILHFINKIRIYSNEFELKILTMIELILITMEVDEILHTIFGQFSLLRAVDSDVRAVNSLRVSLSITSSSVCVSVALMILVAPI